MSICHKCEDYASRDQIIAEFVVDLKCANDRIAELEARYAEMSEAHSRAWKQKTELEAVLKPFAAAAAAFPDADDNEECTFWHPSGLTFAHLKAAAKAIES
jgi:hypothetical protein